MGVLSLFRRGVGHGRGAESHTRMRDTDLQREAEARARSALERAEDRARRLHLRSAPDETDMVRRPQTR